MKMLKILTFAVSILATMFTSLAQDITGHIVPSKTKTIATQVEAIAEEKGKATLLNPKVHPLGIKRLPKVVHTFKAKITRKGIIISEMWPVATVEEMDLLIAKRDGKEVSLSVRATEVVIEEPAKVITVIPTPGFDRGEANSLPAPASKPSAADQPMITNPPTAPLSGSELDRFNQLVKDALSLSEKKEETQPKVENDQKPVAPKMSALTHVKMKEAEIAARTIETKATIQRLALGISLIASPEPTKGFDLRTKPITPVVEREVESPHAGEGLILFFQVLIVAGIVIGVLWFWLKLSSNHHKKKDAWRKANPLTPVDRSLYRPITPEEAMELNPPPGLRINAVKMATHIPEPKVKLVEEEAQISSPQTKVEVSDEQTQIVLTETETVVQEVIIPDAVPVVIHKLNKTGKLPSLPQQRRKRRGIYRLGSTPARA